MSLISLIAALLLEQWRPLADRRYLYTAVSQYAGYFEHQYGDNQKAWSYTMILVGLVMTFLTIYNYFATPKTELPIKAGETEEKNFATVFASFFKKKQIGLVLAFILLFRLGESQLLKMLTPFLVDPIRYELVESSPDANQTKALELYNSKVKTGEKIVVAGVSERTAAALSPPREPCRRVPARCAPTAPARPAPGGPSRATAAACDRR